MGDIVQADPGSAAVSVVDETRSDLVFDQAVQSMGERNDSSLFRSRRRFLFDREALCVNRRATSMAAHEPGVDRSFGHPRCKQDNGPATEHSCGQRAAGRHASSSLTISSAFPIHTSGTLVTAKTANLSKVAIDTHKRILALCGYMVAQNGLFLHQLACQPPNMRSLDAT